MCKSVNCEGHSIGQLKSTAHQCGCAAEVGRTDRLNMAAGLVHQNKLIPETRSIAGCQRHPHGAHLQTVCVCGGASMPVNGSPSFHLSAG